MSDQNTDPTTPPPAPAGRAEDLPAWARDELTTVRNEAAQSRIKKNEATAAHTEALRQIESLTGAQTAAEERASAAEKELLKFQVAMEVGVPGGLIPRLQGSTAEELKADAASLLSQLPSGQFKQNATDPSQGRGDAQGAGLTPGAAFIQKALKGI